MEAFKSMSADELWHLREEVTSTLTRKIAQEKLRLEERLRFLENSKSAIGPNGAAPFLSEGLSEISEPKKSRGEMVRPWKATALAAGAAESGQNTRTFSHCPIIQAKAFFTRSKA